jgi:1-acyl-sn-glycerol-3-phosphate acyltransferase
MVIPFILVYASSILDEILHFEKLQKSPSLTAGIMLIAVSIPMMIISILQYTKYTGELPVSEFPPEKIIRRGLYNYWRHPIYLFYIFSFTAVSLILRSRSMLLIVMPAFIFLTFIYIVKEENILTKRFGTAYVYYRKITGLVLPVFYQSARYPIIIILRYLFRYSAENREMIPDSPPYFIVSEHKNYLDPLFIAAAIHHPVSYLTTWEVYRSSILRWLMERLFCIPKKRFRPDYAANRKLAELIENGGVIGLFPEGERSWTGETQRFKPEVLKLLLKKHDIPILPVKIQGNYHAWPRWSEGMRRYRITVEFRQPLFPDPKITPEALEKQIIQRFGEYSVPEKITKSTIDLVSGIEKVFYRCSECMEINSFQTKGNIINCVKCGFQMSITDDLRLYIMRGGSKKTLSIGGYYNRIRINPEDVGQNIKLSGKCRLSIESGIKLITLLTGELRIEEEKMIITDSEKNVELYYCNISSVTTESNYKLQLFDAPYNKLYQLEFPSASVIQWQDIITSAIFLKTGRQINTR